MPHLQAATSCWVEINFNKTNIKQVFLHCFLPGVGYVLCPQGPGLCIHTPRAKMAGWHHAGVTQTWEGREKKKKLLNEDGSMEVWQVSCSFCPSPDKIFWTQTLTTGQHTPCTHILVLDLIKTKTFVLVLHKQKVIEMSGGAINIPLNDGKTIAIPVDAITFDPATNQVKISDEMSKSAIMKQLESDPQLADYQLRQRFVSDEIDCC